MSLLELALIAIALSMDAFAVSITEGVRMPTLKYSHALKLAFFFGLFQAFMPILGYMAGASVHVFIESIDHWVAFALLAFIGLRMIIESCSRATCDSKPQCQSGFKALCILSLATSIDALAVGISLAIQHANIFFCAVIIGITTFAISFLGVALGRKLGCVFQKKAEIGGGLVLIGIGLNILLEHLI